MTLLRADRIDTIVPVADEAASARLDRFVEAMQPGLLGPRLTAALGGADLPCHVLDAKYEPGVRAMLLYRRGGDLLTGELDPEPSGVVVAPGVRVLAFPQDQGMPTLARVADRDVLGRALAEAVATPSYLLRPRCRTLLLRYRPGKRATFLAALGGDRARYVVKAYHDGKKAAAVAAEAPALGSAASGARTLAFAPVVAHLPALRVLVQRAVPGTPLDVLLGCGEFAARAAVVSAAHALAEFHELAPATVRDRPVERELRRFRSRALGIAAGDPGAGEVLVSLAERLLISWQALPSSRPGPVHGDCTPSQFRVDGGRTFLTDLDHVGISDQAVDVGTFLASLRQLEIRRSLGRDSVRPRARTCALAASFLVAYRQVRARPVEPARIRWHEAAALERKALRAYARAPRSPFAPTLAAAAHRCLDELEVGR
jgi:Ser/Thr protein kinase RdoA (MazF antagonist)